MPQVIEGPIRFFGLCEHHAVPFTGQAHVGYVAHDGITGISKLTRLVRVLTRRLITCARTCRRCGATRRARRGPRVTGRASLGEARPRRNRLAARRVSAVMLSRFAAAALSLVFLAACAGAAEPSPAPSIDGREFVSTSVTEDGVERALVAGTVIRLTFADRRVGGSAGCNQIGGDYAIDAGRLVVGDLASTAMGCDPARHEQDEWLSAFLGAGPTTSLDGAELVLEAGATRIVLIDAAVAEPDLPLVNTWRVESLRRADVVSSVPEGVQASLEFASDGTVLVFPGCNRGGGPVRIGQDVLIFGDMASTRMACDGPAAQVEALVMAILGSRRVTYEVVGETLHLRAGEFGLDLRAGSDFAVDH